MITVMVLALAGCERARPLVRTHSLVNTDKTDSLIMDAKRRAIISIPNPNREHRIPHELGEIERLAFLCAEPSPDALSAISAALTLSPTAGKDALTIAITEAAKQLGNRNATIQLLRDGLYRQCEAFLNGILDDATYSWMANKYVNAMVVLLAIEEITPDPEQNAVRLPVNGKNKQEEDTSEDSEEQEATTAELLLEQLKVETAAVRRNAEVGDAVATAVTKIATQFFQNESVNYCLHMTRYFDFGEDPFFWNVCKLIVGGSMVRADSARVQPPIPDDQERQDILQGN